MRRVVHRVDEHQGADGVGEFCNFRNRVDGADGVGGVANRNQFGLVGEFAFEIVQIQRAVGFTNVDLAHHDTFFFQRAPWRDVGVMIERRDYHFIARFQFAADGARQRKGDGGHVLAKTDFLGRTVEKIGHGLARAGNHGVGAAAGGEGSASIGIVMQ